ncbi:MAG TPA: SxtJ family membrane protein [Bradyrhizobium sp.]|nr:SxtJ family membrane protein [Bradyrhizobium sp.]
MAEPSDHHEYRSHHDIKTSSNRSFGLVFGGVFALLALWSWHKGGAWWPVHLSISVVCMFLAVFFSDVLAPANRIWTKLGLLLAKIVNPVVMGLIFFVIFTPIAVFLRLRGKDLLNLKFDRNASSYWISREPPGPAPESMKEQF